MRIRNVFIISLSVVLMPFTKGIAQNSHTLSIEKTTDFSVTGEGLDPKWGNTNWINLPSRDNTSKAERKKTLMKVLYSNNGLYFLFDCEDQFISSTMTDDYLHLWEEDVIEVFLWPDPLDSVYFEFELSPKNKQLSLLVSVKEGNRYRWRPFHFEDEDRQIVHKTYIRKEDEKETRVKGWRAEFFIPFKMLIPLKNLRPERGTEWKGNFYRVDYDTGGPVINEWQQVDQTFHELDKFGSILFK